MNLARFHFLAPWRNEYSVACLTRKLQGLVNLHWTLRLSDCKVGNIFCSWDALMLAWTWAQLPDLDYSSCPISAFMKLLCFFAVWLKEWRRTCLCSFGGEEAMGEGAGCLGGVVQAKPVFWFCFRTSNLTQSCSSLKQAQETSCVGRLYQIEAPLMVIT